MTPIRMLDGVFYWVIQDRVDINDFVRSILRKEWEADIRDEGRDPTNDKWLADLLGRDWELRALDVADVKPESDYIRSDRLKERRAELRRAIEGYGSVIWPMVVRAEGHLLVDGYCRFSTLREMGVSRLYAYVGSKRTR